MKTRIRHYFLQVLVLASFAIAQPVYDLLSRQADFFVARQSQSADILVAILSISLVVPMIIAIPGLVLGYRVRAATVSILAGLFCALALVQYAEPGIIVFGVLTAIATLMFAVFIYGRPWFLNFAIALSPAVLIFPLIFVFGSPIEKLIIRPGFDAPTNSTMAPTSVVMVVFDELPLVSLLDRGGNIDKELYPGFHELSMSSTWFSKTTTVAEHTLHVLPALLSGKYPQIEKIPDFVDHPNNLFTLLSATHDLSNVNELMTTLCPQTLCWNRKQLDLRFTDRLMYLLSDIGVVYAHKALPTDLRSQLPPVNHAWGGFLRVKSQDYTPRAPATNPLPDDHPFRRLTGSAPGWFMNFLDRLEPAPQPSLHFIHVMMPHYPWRYLPDGRTYLVDAKRVPGLNANNRWERKPESSREGHQRHLLQVGFADKMVGELMSRLRETGLLEQSLVVVTADHGASFTPGSRRRLVARENAAEIMYVPLFIKKPSQTAGNTDDRAADIVDVLPTIISQLSEDHIGRFEGNDLFEKAASHKHTQFVTKRGDRAEGMLDKVDGLPNALAQKIHKFSDGKDPYGLYRFGAFGALVGRPVEEFTIVDNLVFEAKVDAEEAFENVDLTRNHIHSHVSGKIRIESDIGGLSHLVLSLNNTVAATTGLERTDNNKITQFSAILPPQLFLQGKNDLEVFLATRGEDGKVLLNSTRELMD